MKDKLSPEQLEVRKKKTRLGVFGILERGGAVLLGLRNSDDTSFPDCWCHPGGGVEFAESIDAALQREFAEEVILDIEVSQDYLAVHEYLEEGRHVVLIFKEVLSTGRPRSGDGFSHLGWFTIEQIRGLAGRGRTTPLTIIAAEAWQKYKAKK